MNSFVCLLWFRIKTTFIDFLQRHSELNIATYSLYNASPYSVCMCVFNRSWINFIHRKKISKWAAAIELVTNKTTTHFAWYFRSDTVKTQRTRVQFNISQRKATFKIPNTTLNCAFRAYKFVHQYEKLLHKIEEPKNPWKIIMAFMIPVMKNEFDIYRTGRSRTSECSNNSCRSRKVSETRSECPSLSTSPNGMDYGVHRNYINRNNSRAFSRTSSRTSQSSLTSPTKNCSPPKPSSGSQGSLNKFHVRLVDKLRKSFGKGRTEDKSWDSNDEDHSNNTENDDNLLSDSSVAKQTLASSHQIDSTAILKPLKKLSISSDSSALTSADSNDGGLGCSDSSLHIISSKPPLPTHRNRSRSIETAAIKTQHRHSTGSRSWSRHFSCSNSVHDYTDTSKVKR